MFRYVLIQSLECIHDMFVHSLDIADLNPAKLSPFGIAQRQEGGYKVFDLFSAYINVCWEIQNV